MRLREAWQVLWGEKPKQVEVATLPLPKPRQWSISSEMAATAAARGKTNIENAEPIFRLPTAAPGVIPADRKMAVDSAMCGPSGSPINASLYGYANALFGAYEEGLTFVGFPQLAYWSLRSEYRRPCEILADEMTRNWGKVVYSGDDKDSAADKMSKIEAEFTRLGIQGKVRKAFELDGIFGGAQLYIDTGSTDKPNELRTPLALTPAKIKKGSLEAITVVEPMWSYPNQYNSTNPLKPDYYKPESWFVQGVEVHSSRILSIVSREVSDILKATYSFRGLSLLQMMKPYVDNWLETRQSVNSIIQKFSTTVLKTDLSVTTQGSGQAFFNRIMTFVSTRNNDGVIAIDTAEEFENVSAPLGSLDKLQAQAQEHMATPAGIPLVKLFGITPTGLNATAEPEMQAFYEGLSSKQESVGTPALSIILQVVQLHLFGEIDEQIGWKWNPLKHLDKLEAANVDKLKADADAVRITAGIIDPSEAREALAHDEDGPYPGLDLNYTPETPDPDSSGDGNETEPDDKDSK